MTDIPNQGASAPADSQTPQQTPDAPVADTVADSIIETLRFDPFKDRAAAQPAPTPTPSGAGAQASPSVTPPRADQGTGQVPNPAGAPGSNAPAPTQPQGADALTAAAQQIAAAADRLQSPQQVAPQNPNQQKDDLPSYLYDIPPQLVDALSSDDRAQRTAALQHVIAGTARAVHAELSKVINEMRQSLPQTFQQQIQAHTYRQQIRSDFYGRYPALQNEALTPIVSQATQQVMQEAAMSGRPVVWNAQMAQAIADRVFTAIPALRVQNPQAPAQVVAPQVPQAQPPHMFTPGSRPAVGNAVEADIMQTLF